MQWRTGARTRVTLGRGAAIETRADLSSTRSASNDVVNRQTRIQFPDLDVDYGTIADALRLTRFLTLPKLRTTYTRSRTTDYSNSDTPTNISTSSEWSPLFGITGDFKNQTRGELRIQRRVTETENLQLSNTIVTEANTGVDLSLSRQYTRGQKVKLLGKESTVKTSVDLRLTGSYNRRTGETLQAGIDRPQFPISEDRLSLNGQGSYGFSSNVTGHVDLGFGQTRDLQRDIVTRTVRVELRAQFTF